MDIIKGKILSQPRVVGKKLTFDLQSDGQTFTVIRRKREDQIRDIVFLCPGQEVVLCADARGDCVVADKIRITDYTNRQYTLLKNENGEVLYGNSTVCGTDLGDPDV